MNRPWIDTLRDTLNDEPCVLVTITKIRGSAPRETGSRMVVTKNQQWGSIGGGNLEYQACNQARQILEEQSEDFADEQLFGLGPALNQCCGGAVTLLFELFARGHYKWLHDFAPQASAGEEWLVSVVGEGQSQAHRCNPRKTWPGEIPDEIRTQLTESQGRLPFIVLEHDERQFIAESLQPRLVPLAVFGAGHVACALIPMLRGQPFEVHWIDGRKKIFPAGSGKLATLHCDSKPVDIVHDLPDATIFLVMTHSHELDEDICDAVLKRHATSWLGLIGSETKRRRFVHRLAKRGHDEAALRKLVCPVGIAGIGGKRPATIAVTILAQLLRDCVPENWR